MTLLTLRRILFECVGWVVGQGGEWNWGKLTRAFVWCRLCSVLPRKVCLHWRNPTSGLMISRASWNLLSLRILRIVLLPLNSFNILSSRIVPLILLNFSSWSRRPNCLDRPPWTKLCPAFSLSFSLSLQFIRCSPFPFHHVEGNGMNVHKAALIRWSPLCLWQIPLRLRTYSVKPKLVSFNHLLTKYSITVRTKILFFHTWRRRQRKRNNRSVIWRRECLPSSLVGSTLSRSAFLVSLTNVDDGRRIIRSQEGDLGDGMCLCSFFRQRIIFTYLRKFSFAKSDSSWVLKRLRLRVFVESVIRWVPLCHYFLVRYGADKQLNNNFSSRKKMWLSPNRTPS